MSEKIINRRKFLKYLGVSAISITASSIPLQVFADQTNPPPIEGDENSLPLDPNEWNDVFLEEEAELPQDPNILLVDIDSLVK
ncbi:hypothetical protein AB1L05_15350 [Cytobacillus horneckiae]|uniref:hypothetical protein n=1 Tax=Cytobacillus horneckiae TaxID=549687 RepID=UPI0034CD48BA